MSRRIRARRSLRCVWIRFAAWIPLLAKPDTQYHYSNIGYEILGLIAARTAGEPLGSLYRDRIAKPLGLTSAAYDPQGDIAGPHPVGYSVDAREVRSPRRRGAPAASAPRAGSSRAHATRRASSSR